MLTNQTRGALIQLLCSIAPDAVRVLLIKHLNRDIWPINTHVLLEVTSEALPDEMTGLLVELIGDATSVRSDAPTKYVFDGRHGDLKSRLRADGYEVIEDALVRLLPSAEPVAQLRDALDSSLSTSDIDADGEIRRMLKESANDMAAEPPDYNGGITKARVAFETTARRAAAALAAARGLGAPTDSWGHALSFLRQQGVLTQPEEEALAKVYTLVSPGAHVPQGLTAEQWALLSRAFSTSGAYFLLQRYVAA